MENSTNTLFPDMEDNSAREQSNTDNANTLSSSEEVSNSVAEATQPTTTAQEIVEKIVEPLTASIEQVMVQTTAVAIEHAENHDEVHEIAHQEDMLDLEEMYSKMSREELVENLKTATTVDDLATSKAKVGLIRLAFKKHNDEHIKQLKDAFVTDEENPEEFVYTADAVEEEFNNIFKQYKDRRKEEEARHEKEREDNLKAKLAILDELKGLINSEEALKKTYDDFKSLQERWKTIGAVPPKEMNNLWQTYHLYVERFFDYIKINKELKDLDLRKNMEAKMDLCDKVEELLLDSSIKRSFKKLQDYHLMWREIGPVPSDKKEELWERFKAASDALNKRRKEFYDKIQEERERNYALKLALCEKLEQIVEIACVSNKDWEEKTQQISDIQKEWKTIGFAPKKENDEVWLRFKQANDKFFHDRTEFFKVIKTERIDNLNKKLDICAQAEAMQESTDWKQTTAEYLRLQEEWKKVGPIPIKHSDKVWKRFRSACDAFFNNKSKHFSGMDVEQQANLKLKQELIAIVEGFIFSESNEENLGNLKDFQRQWMEIGHVPMRDKDKLYKQFRAAIDKHFENLKLSEADKHSMRFKSRIENIKEGNDGGKAINQEKRFIQNKIMALKTDIATWENNIGFFANSKGADKLREEYEQKLKQAKENIKSLEEKLKIMSEI